MHRLSASLIAGLIATLLLSGVAAGESRVEVIREKDIHFDALATAATQACGFTVELHTIGKTVDIVRYDSDGELVAYTGQAVWDGYFLNPANGRTVSSKIAGPVHVRYLADGTVVETTTGAIYHRNVPGAGLVSVFTGRIRTVFGPTGELLDESFSGQWTGIEGICEHLA